jgi:alpha-beta hydrolase superfamily lysophospholipase
MKNEKFSWQGKRPLKIAAQAWMPEGDPKAVVALVHGLGEHMGRYQHVAEAFNRSELALITMDLPGHGQSEGKRGHASFEEVAGEIDHLLEEAARRCPGKPVFLYGHSLGGELVLYYLLKCRPQLTGAISTSPGLIPGTPVPGWKLLLAQMMNRLVPDFTMPNGLDLANLSRDPQVILLYKKDPLVHDQISARLGWDLLQNGKWIIQNASSLPVPLLLVQGTGDYVVSPQATRQFAQNTPPGVVTFKEWDGYFHETHNEPEKEQVIQYVLDWILSKV